MRLARSRAWLALRIAPWLRPAPSPAVPVGDELGVWDVRAVGNTGRTYQYDGVQLLGVRYAFNDASGHLVPHAEFSRDGMRCYLIPVTQLRSLTRPTTT